MKKLLTLALAALMLASTLASCSTPAEDTVADSVSASGVEYYENMLTERLGYAPENIVIGIGSSDEYGVDMTDFESDGYVIRTVGDATVIFGKTGDGLDRAVRAYAKAVETDTAGALDVVYHEGYRIKRLTIAGRDISEYTVSYPDDANENVKFAVSELIRLVKKACGVELEAVRGEADGYAITFTVSDDPALENDGYRYSVTDDGIDIEHAEARGAMYAVWRFLQNECGWDFLIYGDSYLNEADHVDVPAGTEGAETPAFEFTNLYNPYKDYKNECASPTPVQNSYGTVSHACHGLQNNNFFRDPYGGTTDFLSQPCFTDEEKYEICKENVEKFILANYGSPAFKEVDIAQYDTDDYCFCETCFDVFMEEGGNAGAVVRFANRLSEELDAKYPGIVYKIFGYAGTNVPPKVTSPSELVYVTFCYDMNCSNHKVDGTECTGKVAQNKRNNADYAEWFEGWCDITPNVYIWPYTLGTGLNAYTVLDNIYDDYRYYAENDVRGIMLESEDYGNFSLKYIEHMLIAELNWNIDMTREEFDYLTDRALQLEYGDGWECIAEYIDQWILAEDMTGCWHCWGWNVPGGWEERYDPGFFMTRFDNFIELFDAAEAQANSGNQISRLKRLRASMLYMGCYSSYYFAWLDGDSDRMAVLGERYAEAMDIVRGFGYDPTNLPTLSGGDYAVHYSTTIEEAAWKDWVKYFDRVMGQKLPDDAPVINE